MPEPYEDARLGRQIAMDDQHIIATVDRTTLNGQFFIRALAVFAEVEQGQWELVQMIEDPNDEPDDNFGAAVEISGDRMIVGAPDRVIDFPSIVGAICVYERTNGVWSLDATIEATDASERRLGRVSTTIHGDVIASATNWSHLAIFERDESNTWARSALLPVPALVGHGSNGQIDHGIDASEDQIVLTRGSSGAGGSLRVARRTENGWTVQTPVRPNHYFYGDAPVDPASEGLGIIYFGMDVCVAEGQVHVLAALRKSIPLGVIPCVTTFDPSDTIGADQNSNGVCDLQDFLDGTLGPDYDLNGLEDASEIAAGLAQDCNGNGVVDSIEGDCDGDGIPDDCEPDCDGNGIPDHCESFYDIDPGLGLQYVFFSPGGGQYAHHVAVLAPIEIQPGGEVLQSASFQLPAIVDNLDFRVVVYRDADGDGDPTNAELIHTSAVDIEGGHYFSGVTVSLPDLWVGNAGDYVYVGYLMSPFRPGESMFAGVYVYDDPSAFTGSWVTYWNVDPHLQENVNYADLSTGDLQQPVWNIRADINAHFGPRQDCCDSADLDQDGSVGVNDLLGVLAAWGPCAELCPADINGDQTVDVTDLLDLLSFWGTCDP